MTLLFGSVHPQFTFLSACEICVWHGRPPARYLIGKWCSGHAVDGIGCFETDIALDLGLCTVAVTVWHEHSDSGEQCAGTTLTLEEKSKDVRVKQRTTIVMAISR